MDAAAILKASRGVASQVVTLRKRQLDAYSKTSSLAQAVKSQTDRVTLTAKAASALSKRFSETSPQYDTQTPAPNASDTFPPIPSEEKDAGTSRAAPSKQGIEQDHFYQRSKANSVTEAAPQETLRIRQEKANEAPLPDGTIPPAGNLREALHRSNVANDPSPDRAKWLQRQSETQIPAETAEPPPPSPSTTDAGEAQELSVSQEQDVFYTPPQKSGLVLSALPRTKLPKNTEDWQGSDENVPDDGINQDVFYSSKSKPQSQARSAVQASPERDSISDDSYSQLFHSPKVASLLRGGPKKFSSPKDLGPASVTRNSNEQTNAEEQDQVSSTIRISPADAAPTNAIDVHDLAADVAKNDSVSTANATQVI